MLKHTVSVGRPVSRFVRVCMSLCGIVDERAGHKLSHAQGYGFCESACILVCPGWSTSYQMLKDKGSVGRMLQDRVSVGRPVSRFSRVFPGFRFVDERAGHTSKLSNAQGYL